MNVNLLSDRVMENLSKRYESLSDEQLFALISSMSIYKIMNEFLLWEGIIGYTDLIIKAYESIKEASEIPDKK